MTRSSAAKWSGLFGGFSRRALGQIGPLLDEANVTRGERAHAGMTQAAETGARLDPHDLAGIHDVIGVERDLELGHHPDGIAVFGLQEFHLAGANPMLAGACSTLRFSPNTCSRSPVSRNSQRGIAL